MRNRIVVKLFLLTTALCLFILAAFLIGQTLFFKKYYVSQKIEDMKASIHSFEKAYLKNSGHEEALQRLERDFYQKHHAWVTTLDRYGNLENANDFYLEVKLNPSRNQEFTKKKIEVPLYNLVNTEDVATGGLPFSRGTEISIYGIKKGRAFVPYIIAKGGTFPRGTFGTLTPRQLEIKKGIFLENKVLEKKVGQMLDEEHPVKHDTQPPVTIVNGTIKDVVQPNGNVPFIYSNHLFMERIKTFQANLLLGNVQYRDDSFHVLDFKRNGIKYKQFIKPVKDKNGATTYIFSMVSLQPVDEAIQMFKTYSVYIIGFVLLLIILASIYYSRTIAGPLLRINKTTRKIANLDFSENVAVKSKDEIGDLSRNINLLSDTLHSHIDQLQQDIEKEKKLEDTRKEFISGVSHELKTPLSTIKSCISVLKDGVASHKKDHYFKAMEKEVDKMNLLVVDMLELAKFESGTYKMKMDAFDIAQTIENVCEQLSLDITKKHVNVYTYLDRLKVMANQHRIEQVLTNFITNAIRYTPEKQDIIISTVEDNEQVKICVENKGTHIEVEQLDKIWDRFYRGDSSRRRSEGGTGLGLAISKNILELHGVKYGVSNTEDGVLFFFYLDKKG
ncbi:sensor histidine kinase [Tuberibacillus sp. Marseille-P3662]|uniref:sensor histidine kinase n=1 Tax=Tuberibacillus sp. Marseille-P3662 TaxID=1965358 RepID=UPI000A1C9D72|nr:HAMP domain-containing sensor histidine kinase [Tuberibacillus sp. Marseille-P3662]